MYSREAWFDLSSGDSATTATRVAEDVTVARSLKDGHKRRSPAHRGAQSARTRQTYADQQRQLGVFSLSKLEELQRRIAELTRITSRRKEVDKEHAVLSEQLQVERKASRERERSLAMELAEIDGHLADAKSQLSLRLSRNAAVAATALKQATTPLALESRWAAEAVDGLGCYVIIQRAVVSSRRDVLAPSEGQPVAILEAGTEVTVVEVTRCPALCRIRARIEQPAGWISLVEVGENGTRWARWKPDMVTNRKSPAASLVEENAGSRSAALRGWRARVDAQSQAFQGALDDALGAAARGSQGGPYMFAPLRLAPAARRLSTEALRRCNSIMVAEVRTDHTHLEMERAAMELCDEESAVAALSQTVRKLSATNADLALANKKLQFSVDKLKDTSTDISTDAELGLLGSWSGIFSQSGFSDHEVDYSSMVKSSVTLPSSDAGETHVTFESQAVGMTAKVNDGSSAADPGGGQPWRRLTSISEETNQQSSQEDSHIPLRTLSSKFAHDAEIGELFSHMADLGEKDTMATQSKIDSTLRKAAELQRQRAERFQEMTDLQLKLAPLRSAAAGKRAGRLLSSSHSRLRRIEDVISFLVGSAREEMELLEEWMRSVEVRMAWLLEALGSPPDARRAWLKEAIGKAPGNPYGSPIAVSKKRTRSLLVSSEADSIEESLKPPYASKQQPELEGWAEHSQRPLQEQEQQVEHQLQRAISEQHEEALLARKRHLAELDAVMDFNKMPLPSEYELAAKQVQKEEERQGLYSESVNRMQELEQQLRQQQVQLQKQQESEMQELHGLQEQELALLDQQLPLDQQPLDHHESDVHFRKGQLSKKFLQEQSDLHSHHQQQLQQLMDVRQQHEHTLQQQEDMQQQHFEYVQDLKRDLLVKAGERHVTELFPEPGNNKMRWASHGSAVDTYPGHQVQVENATEEEILAAFRDALSLFCPKLPGSRSPMVDGSRALWSLLAKLSALSAYVQTEFSEVGRSAVQVDQRREKYALADSRFAQERKFGDEWQEKLQPPGLASTIPPYAVD